MGMKWPDRLARYWVPVRTQTLVRGRNDILRILVASCHLEPPALSQPRYHPISTQRTRNDLLLGDPMTSCDRIGQGLNDRTIASNRRPYSMKFVRNDSSLAEVAGP